jgi:hypothetical protein
MDNFNQKIQEEVDRNYEFFKKELPRMMFRHAGQFALLRNAAVVEYFDTFGDAEKYARKVFQDGLFSIQKVEDTVANLGFLGTLGYA